MYWSGRHGDTEMAKRIRALTLCDYYLPGYKAGGAVRSVVNMVEQLSDAIDSSIITRDRDIGNDIAYENVCVDQWNAMGPARVFYLSNGWRSLLRLRYLISDTPCDVIYLNSLFSPRFAILPLLMRRLGFVPRRPFILAPRGELSPGALAIKSHKKRLYLRTARMIGLLSEGLWQASTPLEEEDIRRWFPNAQVQVARDIPGKAPVLLNARDTKLPGELKVIFLSRISCIKNLDGALRMLAGVRGHIRFDIYGPKEDPVYWKDCEELIKRLPGNIEVRYRGTVNHEEVNGVFSRAHLFLFPTHGENYGHVIHESLLAGCPVLISDQTPWRNLTRLGIGWDLSLVHPKAFGDALQHCVDLDEEAFLELSRAARKYGLTSGVDDDVKKENMLLFSQAVAASASEKHA